jgi:hypothetical protein
MIGFKIKNKNIEKGELLDKIFFSKKVKVKTIKMADTNNNLIELIYFYNFKKKQTKLTMPFTEGYTHLSITVSNIDKLYKKLKKNNISFNSEPKVSEDKKVKMTYCRTPENAYLELVEVLPNNI